LNELLKSAERVPVAEVKLPVMPLAVTISAFAVPWVKEPIIAAPIKINFFMFDLGF
jgi:hypothetical protein